MSRAKDFTVRPFDKLRKNLERKSAPAAPLPVRSKKNDEYTDEEAFGREMAEVHQIREFQSLSCAHAPRKTMKPAAVIDLDHDAIVVLSELAAGTRPIDLPDTQEYIEWVNPRCQEALLPLLHNGRYAVQAFVDLHGCTAGEAEEELDRFIHEALRRGWSCVKVIHGRGLRSVRGARLKDVVARRLSGHFRKVVVAFATARQCDGGLGALYVLLGRKSTTREKRS